MEEAARPVMGPEPPPAAEPAAPARGDMSSSALFWGEGDDIDPDNPDMAALLALQEECTPEERAEAFKARATRAIAGARGARAPARPLRAQPSRRGPDAGARRCKATRA